MQTWNSPMVVSVFKDNGQAQKAIADLEQAGFRADQIRYSVKQGGGGIADDLERMGLPDREANFYNNEFNQGHTIVTVNTNDQQQRAYDILMRDGGYDANMGDVRGQNAGPYAANAATTAANYGATANTSPAGARDINQGGTQDIKLREEELQATKERVQAGEVDIRKDVVTEQKTINVPVTHEEVVIERHPVTGQPQASTTPIDQNAEQTIRIPVTEEKVDVEKETVVTGEVSVGKRAVQETEQFTDTVRREELHVDRQGDVDIEGNLPNTAGNQAANPPNNAVNRAKNAVNPNNPKKRNNPNNPSNR